MFKVHILINAIAGHPSRAGNGASQHVWDQIDLAATVFLYFLLRLATEIGEKAKTMDDRYNDLIAMQQQLMTDDAPDRPGLCQLQ